MGLYCAAPHALLKFDNNRVMRLYNKSVGGNIMVTNSKSLLFIAEVLMNKSL